MLRADSEVIKGLTKVCWTFGLQKPQSVCSPLLAGGAACSRRCWFHFCSHATIFFFSDLLFLAGVLLPAFSVIVAVGLFRLFFCHFQLDFMSPETFPAAGKLLKNFCSPLFYPQTMPKSGFQASVCSVGVPGEVLLSSLFCFLTGVFLGATVD